MTRDLRASRMWENISERWVTKDAADDLTGFKSDLRNFNLALWDPRTNGIRYLKYLVYNLAAGLTDDDWARLRRIENRDVGDPVTVRYNGERVCMDYLQSLFELAFIAREVDLRGGRVLEIGAGYGRTCHAILSNFDIASYHIIDLENTLRLSRRYLREVLNDAQYAKLRFVQVDDVDGMPDSARFDLCVNIHSFGEMRPAVVRAYLDLIRDTCGAFYTKNPVGKYADKSMDDHAKGTEAVRMALETGLLRQVVDVHDSQAVEAAVPRFIEAYRPGDAWRCASHAWGVPWNYFWQALYVNDTDAPTLAG